MRKPKWQAKAFYVIFALALIVGLVPLTALAGEATICISGPAYAKEGETIMFTAETNPLADSVTWDMPTEFVQTGLIDSSIEGYFAAGSAGSTYVVHAVGHWGANLVQDAYFEILIGVGLIPQVEYNIIGDSAEFCVPELYSGHVTGWRFEASSQLGTGWSVVDGGEPEDDCVVVHGSTWGELVIYADTEEFQQTSTPYATIPATSLMAIKKWGKIYDTWLFGWHEYAEQQIWGSGETQVYWDEDTKSWIGGALLIDLIIGNFITDGGEQFTAFADGADVEWWVMDARAPVETLPSGIPAGDWLDPVHGPQPGLVTLIEQMQAEYPSHHVGFGGCDTKYYESDGLTALDAGFEDLAGVNEVPLVACGEEAVKIVVVAKYPDGLHYTEWPVFPEFISWNFWTQEVEKVPLVRWAGEEVVLEKQFGVSYAGDPVNFILEGQSIGALEGLSPQDNRDANGRSVWTTVDSYGVARALLHSQSQGKSNVIALLYEGDSTSAGELINKHGFMVYWLAIESVTLSNMQGERTGHNDGLWDPVVDSGLVYDAFPNDIYDPTKNWEPDRFVGKTLKVWKGELQSDGSVTFIGDLQIREIASNTANTVVVTQNWDNIPNPPGPDVQWYYEIVDPVWDPATDDLSQQLNVSQDALLRVRVKGWFYDPERESIRDKSWCDANANGVKDMYDYILPEGRWVLPDDWQYLAGPDWEQNRPHWDIMDQPNDNIMSAVDRNLDHMEELGSYFAWKLNESPLELDIPGDLVAQAPVIGPYSGLDTYTPTIDHPIKLDWKTIIPNGKLNWWDAPMPPAKILFEVMSGPGFFKDADKGDIYYQLVNTPYEYPPEADGIVYTNPYYMTHIAESPFIPPFIIGGGYDWDSWNKAYGPYPFWTIINQPPGLMPSTDDHPTKVEVYSDNHGEAMVWLNGDWNLDLSAWVTNGGLDVPPGTLVGDTTVMAAADYPYFRGEFPKVLSNDVEKSWTWGKQILGADTHEYVDFSWDPFNTRMVFQVGTLGPDGKSDKKMAFIWVCDRDGKPAVGEQIDWWVAPNTAEIAPIDAITQGVSIYGLMTDIHVQDGFLLGTLVSPNGKVGGANAARDRGTSFARIPTDTEKDLFRKFQEAGVYPADLDVNDYAVAAIEVLSSIQIEYDLTILLHEGDLGTMIRHTELDFSVADAPDDPLAQIMRGDANGDQLVNAGDITKIKRVYFGLDAWTAAADVNKDGTVDTGDITQVKRIYFGM